MTIANVQGDAQDAATVDMTDPDSLAEAIERDRRKRERRLQVNALNPVKT